MQSSLVFSDALEQIDTAQVADLKEDLETARNWCMDQLRPVLRARFHTWMAATGAPEMEGREQLNEREASQAEPLQLAVG
jgi:hypothetical protein